MDQEHKNNVTIDKIIVVSNGKPQKSHESTPSSVTSGGSDTIGSSSKEIDTLHIEINKEIDKLFGPTLERTRSGSDIEVIAPLRQRKRQYRSQEILSHDRPLNETVESGSKYRGLDAMHIEESNNIIDSNQQQVSILYDNQRAEIVASVTERLYNKLKRNEKVVAKMETMVDKKIMQPLNELKICSNARQRLVELSQKAIKHKRRIGIPAYTQTKKYATRVKDQGVDIQKDLQHYAHYSSLNRICTLQKNVATETESITLRYKEAAVGSKCGTLDIMDRSTLTTNTKIIYKNSFTMTDITKKCDCSTQTHILPPPRRKKRSLLSKYLRKSELHQSRSIQNQTPIININISPIYPVESDSSHENSECSENKEISATAKENSNSIKITNMRTEKNDIVDFSNTIEKVDVSENNIDDFSDDDGLSRLPRATTISDTQIGCSDYEEMVLGRNQYPYNVKLSPLKDNDEMKRVIRFKDIDVTPAECSSAKWLEKVNTSLDIFSNENQCNNYYKSSGSLSIDSSDLRNIKFDFLSKITPSHSRLDNIMNSAENCVSTGIKGHKLQYDNCVKYSFSESELRSNHDINSRFSYLSKDNIGKVENMLDTKKNNFNMTENRRFNEFCSIPDNKYLSNGNLAPTEYLKQLILIRRETVAANYKSPI